MLVSAVTFCYEWIPNVMANFLVYLGTFPTWIAPNNVAVNQAFGGVTGIGILPISLDWSGVAVSTPSAGAHPRMLTCISRGLVTLSLLLASPCSTCLLEAFSSSSSPC